MSRSDERANAGGVDRFRSLARAALWAALAFALVMALVPRPPRLPGEPSDKIQHIVGFAVLTALAVAAYPRASPVRIALWLAAFGAAIELLQLIPALHRDGQWLDWLADVGAVSAVLVAAVLLRRLRTTPWSGAR